MFNPHEYLSTSENESVVDVDYVPIAVDHYVGVMTILHLVYGGSSMSYIMIAIPQEVSNLQQVCQ